MLSTSRTVRNDHVGRARFRVIWMKTLVIDSRNGDRVYAVRITVKVALIIVRRAISTSENEDGA